MSEAGSAVARRAKVLPVSLDWAAPGWAWYAAGAMADEPKTKPDKRDRADAPLVVRIPDGKHDRVRWPLVGGVAVVALATGWFWPRACGLKFGTETTEEVTATSAAPEVATEAPVVTAPTASNAPPPPADTAPKFSTVTVGKASLIHCGDVANKDLKPSKCGDPLLDGVIMPKLEDLSTCDDTKGVTGRIALTLEIDFKKKSLKASAGRSSVKKNGTPNDKAIEPVLGCVRTAMHDLFDLADAQGKRDHVRYTIGYPLTLAPPPGADVAPAPSGSVAAEKPATGSAKVTVDAALVRDAPSTSGTMVQRLTRGTKVEIYGVAGNWYHIHFGDGDAQAGWIFKTNVGK